MTMIEISDNRVGGKTDRVPLRELVKWFKSCFRDEMFKEGHWPFARAFNTALMDYEKNGLKVYGTVIHEFMDEAYDIYKSLIVPPITYVGEDESNDYELNDSAWLDVGKGKTLWIRSDIDKIIIDVVSSTDAEETFETFIINNAE